MKFYTLFKSQFINTMYSFSCIFLVSVFSSMIKLFGLILTCLSRSRTEHIVIKENVLDFNKSHSRNDDEIISKNSTAFLPSGFVDKGSLESSGVLMEEETEDDDSVLLSNNNKYQFMSQENLVEYVEEVKTMKFTVHEMFEGSNDELLGCDQSPVCENSSMKEVEKSLQLFDEDESDSSSSSFVFKFKFNSYSPTSDDNQELVNILNEKDEKEPTEFHKVNEDLSLLEELDFIVEEEVENIFHDEEKSTELHEVNKDSILFEGIGFIDDEEKDAEFHKVIEDSSLLEGIVDDEIMEKEEFSYEVELRPDLIHTPDHDHAINDVIISGIDKETKSKEEVYMQTNDQRKKIEFIVEDLDEEFIEFEPQLDTVYDTSKSSNSGEMDEENWDGFDSDDSDEQDAISEHENLVQQMKMELKNCRIGGLPTISEECENFKVLEDLRPLNIHQKFDYKDVMEGIQKFYKSYSDKMRKLDILNYQTLHAISFLQLKESEVFTRGKKKSLNLSKIWSYKDKKIYADPLRKSISEMKNDLELVYIGQVCLSWEILCWLYVKAQELMEYDSRGYHSYNRVAEEFQQFQVLVQRFIEDEPFEGPIRVQNYVKNRCSIRSLLQVPSIKDDSLKDKKERVEEKDAIPLSSVIEMIMESMLIVKEFVYADKSARNVDLNEEEGENSELRVDIMMQLEKKDRGIKEEKRSRNCIVKKLKKDEECGMERQVLMWSQVELRLVSKVVGMRKITRDQLIWCQTKLRNINFVRRRLHFDPSFFALSLLM